MVTGAALLASREMMAQRRFCRREFVDHRVSGDDFRAKADARAQAAYGQEGHIGGEGADERETAEQQQIQLVRHAAALEIADKAGQ